MNATDTLPVLRRLSAFSTSTSGGNPAGVWLGDELPSPRRMQEIAADVGYSETAFLSPRGERRFVIRYYSPEAEVPFCGHATIASGVFLGDREGAGHFDLETSVGEVPVEVERQDGDLRASLTSVTPRHHLASSELVAEALGPLGWHLDELDPAIPPAVAFAGASHLVLAVRDASTLARLEYDFDALKALMLAHDLTTLQLIWREDESTFHARNPFPVGGVVEDPATGAAAAALGGYLRDAGLLDAPATVLIRQGEAMGRPSRLTVTIPPGGGITVSGTAVFMDASAEGSAA